MEEETKEKTQKKKLLIATDSFLPRWDGISRFLSDIIPELKDEYDITVLAPEIPGKFEGIEGIQVIRFPLSFMKAGDYTVAKPNSKIIRKHVLESDIVFTNSIGPIGAFTMLSAYSMNKPLVSYVHSIEWELFAKALSKSEALEYFVYFFTKIYMRRLYNKCSLIMVPSLETAELLRRERIIAMKAVVPLGINTNKFMPGNSKEAKVKLGLKEDDFVVGFTGRISREKDVITLFKAYKRLKRRNPRLKLLIVGDGLESIKSELAKDKGVMMPGPVNNVVPYLQAMDIYVLPSLTETSSLSTMEAMACALPVVVTRVGNVKFYIKDRKNGVFFPKQNITVLSLKLDWLIKNPDLRKELGNNARQTILDHYQWMHTVDRLKKIFEDI